MKPSGDKSPGVSQENSQGKKSDNSPAEAEGEKKSEKKKKEESFEHPFHPFQFFGKYPQGPGFPFMPFPYPYQGAYYSVQPPYPGMSAP